MGILKNALRVLSVGAALSAPIQGQAQEQPAPMTPTQEQTTTSEEWITRVPVGNGWRTEPVTSLDEALKNPALKDHIYLAGVGDIKHRWRMV